MGDLPEITEEAGGRGPISLIFHLFASAHFVSKRIRVSLMYDLGSVHWRTELLVRELGLVVSEGKQSLEIGREVLW